MTITSTIRMTISQMPLDVDRGIELPQLELTHNFTGDCTTAYSTGFPFHFCPDISIIESPTNGFESPSYRIFWALRTCLRLPSFCWGEIVLSILPKDRSLLLPWNWKYRPSKNLEIRLSPKHFPEELLISSKKDFAFQFLAIKTFSFQTFFLPLPKDSPSPSQEISHVWKLCSSSKGDWGEEHSSEFKIDFMSLVQYDKFTWHLRYYLFHTYVPTCLIVIMSWISFWIKPEVTLFRNMSNGQKQNKLFARSFIFFNV